MVGRQEMQFSDASIASEENIAVNQHKFTSSHVYQVSGGAKCMVHVHVLTFDSRKVEDISR